MTDTEKLPYRERVAVTLLLFALKIVNPTGYRHEIDNLKTALEDL